MDLDVGERQAVVEIGDIGEFAAQPVDRLAHDDVESARLRIVQQALKPWPEVAAGAAHRRVIIDRRLRPALAFDITAAELDLVSNRCLALVLGRIAGIDHGTHGEAPIPREECRLDRPQVVWKALLFNARSGNY
jgi:hypothetical protein